jgi:phosphatidylinositol alpha-mannosyltransferase
MAQKVVNAAGPEIAVIGTFHILPSNRLSSWGSKGLRKMYRTGLGRFDQVISVSMPAAEFAQKNFGLKSVILPNVVELERFRTDTVIKQSNVIVFLGRLVRRKGCSELIKAYALLKKSLPAVNLVIGGDGPERKPLKRLVNKLGLDDSIKFAGYIEENKKSELLASAQIACFPATGGESFGIVLLEAMAAGSGVVLGGNNPGYASVLGEQPLLLVNPYDTQEFASRLQLLLTQKATIQGLQSWQTENVRQYDVNIVGKKLENIYKAAIANRGKSRHN